MKPIKSSIAVLGIMLMLITVFSCNQEKISTATVIKGSMIGFEYQDLIIKNSNPFVFDVDTIALGENGSFIFDVDINKPEYYTLSVGKSNMMLYVRPGDSVIFTSESSDLLESIRFSGDAPIYNDYLTRSNRISFDFQSSLMQLFSFQEGVIVAAIDSVRALHADEMAALQRGTSNLDPYFLEIEKARIIYEWAILHRVYPDYYNYIHHTTDFKTSPEFDTYLAQVDLNDEKLLGLPLYVSFLETYLRKGYNEYYVDSTLRDEFPLYINYQLNLIDKSFESHDIKSILAYNSVKQQITYDGVKDIDAYWPKFTSLCNNEGLKIKLNVLLDDWKHLKRGEPAKDFTYVNIKGEGISLSSFLGKWIYIDIWATWCNPCIAEIPKLKELEHSMRDQNIVFMSISVDQTRELWQKMVIEKELKGVQIWAGQDETIKEFYKVSGIPRFMIIDPEGNVYEASADRPSMNVGEQLSALLAGAI